MQRIHLIFLAFVTLPFAALSPVLAQDAQQSAQPTARPVYPNGLTLTADGQLLISDIGTHSIYKCDRDGRLTVFAGTGKAGYSGDGGPATEARLNAPFDLLALENGDILVADTYNHRIRRIDRAGKISTIAGNGKSTYAGDGGRAVEASLQLPQGIAVDRDGNMYIADTFNHVLRRVDAEGTITTFAGSEPGLAGDGGPATKAQLNLPMAVAVDTQGLVYFSDASNSRVRRVNRDSSIETIAGFGPGAALGGAGFQGDDGPPARAKLFSAADIRLGPAGDLYISDTGNNRIRVIREGSISTLAGTGVPDFSGDGGPATDAALRAPQKMAVAPDGTIYVADRANHRVRVIDPVGQIRTFVGDGTPHDAIRVGSQ
jgi:sugar lactone lactonase YvrE